MHTHCSMTLSPNAITIFDSKVEAACRKIWNLPKEFPRAGLHAPNAELGLNLPTIWEDYCATATNSRTRIFNDNKALEATSRASLCQAVARFEKLPLELAFHTNRGGRPLCPSIITRNIATLVAANLHPMGGPEIWLGSSISITLTTTIPINIDEDHGRTPSQPYTSINRILRKLTPYGNKTYIHGNNLHDFPQTNALTYYRSKNSYG